MNDVIGVEIGRLPMEGHTGAVGRLPMDGRRLQGLDCMDDDYLEAWGTEPANTETTETQL